jgi:hypothetical protein
LSQLQEHQDHVDDALSLHGSIPDSLRVSAGGQLFPVDFTSTKRALGEFVHATPPRRAELLAGLQAHFADMQTGAAEFAIADDSHAAREKLKDILDRREFRRASERSWWEAWRDKIAEWLLRQLQKLRMPGGDAGNRILIWLLIAIISSLLAIWLRRLAMHRQPAVQYTPVPFAPSARNWRFWLEDARHAAGDDNWREAIHLAYWAAISHLEESGAWIPDRARTPREYLRLLAASSARRSVLGELTGQFESIWYGGRVAAEADFQHTLNFLEQLGCR